MNKGLIAFVAIFIVLIVITYIYTGFHFPKSPIKTTSTTIFSTVYTTIPTNSTQSTTTINYSNSETPCLQFYIIGQAFNQTYIAKCKSEGGTLGLWVAAGNSGKESVQIIGADGKTYVNQTSNYNCTTFYQNFTGPAQLYTIYFKTGIGNGSCGNAKIVINGTTTPPQNVYTYIYNGNFGNGEYTGWNVTNPGFGIAPLNISRANGYNNLTCYEGQPWSNYAGGYFATTYNCGVSVAPGNITSSTFVVSPSTPFLNFRVISPEDNDLYVELFRQTYNDGNQVLTPIVIDHINTYNLTINADSSSTFANVSIPLTSYINQNLRVRVVAKSFNNYIAIGDFNLAKRPNQQKGVVMNLTVFSS